ncbi:hypothetical protein INN71_15300 [Nocardioides sp. ChNu-153]|uniref:hypothetical protein n=1 Tax=unclassified Nocardioides TaxID=2615069 RepID=UPI0024051CB9|nr:MULTISPECIES: hypothetical protein [unclassified Nocardioides]MDF9716283.1 hypothetical protein [Nocardioides sp. ChNu-99]MDN7122755.1 hypothetical protein [Nocardioides sp. ChNu-153]
MTEQPRPHHRPTRPGSAFFEARNGGPDPAELTAAADRAAHLLVRGAAATDDSTLADRVVRLADTEGLETLAELWSGAGADTLSGCLWRLYALRSWVYADPVGAARQFDAGRLRAPLARVVAGVSEPPGPDELRRMIDEVLRGIAEREFADVLLRAAAFARVVAVGRAALEVAEDETERVLALSEQLEHAGHLELAGTLA